MTSNIEELKSKFEQEVEKMRQLEKGLIFKCLDFSICLSKFAEILDRLKCMVWYWNMKLIVGSVATLAGKYFSSSYVSRTDGE